jgi:glycosyltransferase involved in cell wall biosynthesis
VVVADRPPKIDGIPVEYRRWKLEDEITSFDGIRVGLMPLDDSPWSRGKCAFKALQYMSLGIPPVVSPVGMNREVVVHGENGFVAQTTGDWVESIDILLSDAHVARRLADAARRKVEAEYSLEVNSRRLVEILRNFNSWEGVL